MEPPRQLRDAANEGTDVTIDSREYEDEDVVVIDFGPGAEVSLDVIGETAIVVAGDRQIEFQVPPDASELTVNDGMLLIRERSEQ